MLLGVGAIGRIMYAPIPLNFLMPTLLLPFKKGYDVAYDRVELAWEGWSQPLVLRVTNFAIGFCGQGPLLIVPKAIINVKLSALLKRHFVPTSISLSRPELLLPIQSPIQGDEMPPETTEELLKYIVTTWAAIGKGIDYAVHQTPWRKLKQIQIEGGTVMFGQQSVGWSVSELNLYLVRDAVAVQGTMSAALERYTQRSLLNARLSYALETRVLNLEHQAKNINLAALLKQQSSLPFQLSTPLNIEANAVIRLDQDQSIPEVNLKITGEGGTLALPGLYPQEIELKHIACKALATPTHMAIEELQIDTAAGPSVEGRGGYQYDGQFKGEVAATQLHFQDLSTWWPESLAPVVRSWVTRNIAQGDIQNATISLDGQWHPGQGMSIKDIGGVIEFTKSTLDYITDMPLIKDITGRARYTQKLFDIDISSGQTKDLQIKTGHILLQGLDMPDQEATVDLKIAGPAAQALDLADHKPLYFLKENGFTINQVSGNAEMDLHITFPLKTSLTTSEVEGTVMAKLQNFAMQLPVAGHTLKLTQGDMTLDIAQGVLNITGQVLADNALANFIWKQHIGQSWQLKAETTAPLTQAQPWVNVQQFLPQESEALPVKINLDITSPNSHKIALKAQADLTPVAVNMRQLNWQKPTGEAASLDLSLVFKNDRLESIENLLVRVGDNKMRVSGVYHPTADAFQSLTVHECRLGHHDWQLRLVPPGQGPRKVEITGKCLDIEGLMDYDPAPTDGLSAYGPIDAHIQLKQMRFGDGRILYNPDIKAYRNHNLWQRMHVQGFLDTQGQHQLAVQLLPTQGGEELTVESSNGGAVLRLMGITDNIRGGQLQVQAQRTLAADAQTRQGTKLVGRMTLQEYAIINAGFFTRLFSLAMVVGVVDLMMGEGIAFSQGKIKFEIMDEFIRLDRGLASGVSLGITLEGIINRATKVIELRGSLIPMYLLNTLIRKIPLIGKVLTGGEKGVFATSFHVTGSQSDPKVTANPLSMLAPGMVKQFFKEPHPAHQGVR
jgi:hypothetical protein